ncbi:hypothetical protein NDU88_002757 [Pleurodeles waltl]|uniref:Uncharacterized protein n=1 Tax=Pleurodeles waltl TaxID=8319 RepID=A0AAV7P7J5_PLEWA|nr:hypothetical protein NDU88_002757 [Pleurodeles waltl]
MAASEPLHPPLPPGGRTAGGGREKKAGRVRPRSTVRPFLAICLAAPQRPPRPPQPFIPNGEIRASWG